MTDNDENQSDHELFMRAMQDVTPLKSNHKMPNAAFQSKKVIKKPAPPSFSRKVVLSDYCSVEITPEQYLRYMTAGIQPNYFRKLMQGKIPIQAELDLHHYTIDQARDHLLIFIDLALKRKYRCVRIIHGKGHRGQSEIPILKSKTYTWLRQLPEILAFSSCQPKDGGAGAVYVLLRRS